MSAGAIAAAMFALLAMAAGFVMVFRQDLVRKLWRNDQPATTPSPQDDPAHYVLNIFGMMLLAFGLTIVGFVTSYALLG